MEGTYTSPYSLDLSMKEVKKNPSRLVTLRPQTVHNSTESVQDSALHSLHTKTESDAVNTQQSSP